jgi:cytochrome P450
VIERGRPAFVLIGGANRDPAVFEQPDVFRIGRPDPGRHLSFSLGIHHCLGAALARLEARVAIEELTRRYAPLELAAAPARRSMLVLRGYERRRHRRGTGPDRRPPSRSCSRWPGLSPSAGPRWPSASC